MTSRIKTTAEIDAMRHGGQVLAQILVLLEQRICAGMTPKDLSALAAAELKRHKVKPAFLGFEGYPDVICISVNDQVQHAIPSAVPLKNGDVVNFDFGVLHQGLITDAGLTTIVGGQAINQRDAELVEGTKKALERGISAVKAGARTGDISAAIEAELRRHNLGIVRELVGHGVGDSLHEDPEIPNYGTAGKGPILKSGMTIAIEPITTTGRPDIYIEHDGWTIRTWDGGNSAQFEHTVVVTDDGCEILTQSS